MRRAPRVPTRLASGGLASLVAVSWDAGTRPPVADFETRANWPCKAENSPVASRVRHEDANSGLNAEGFASPPCYRVGNPSSPWGAWCILDRARRPRRGDDHAGRVSNHDRVPIACAVRRLRRPSHWPSRLCGAVRGCSRVRAYLSHPHRVHQGRDFSCHLPYRPFLFIQATTFRTEAPF